MLFFLTGRCPRGIYFAYIELHFAQQNRPSWRWGLWIIPLALTFLKFVLPFTNTPPHTQKKKNLAHKIKRGDNCTVKCHILDLISSLKSASMNFLFPCGLKNLNSRLSMDKTFITGRSWFFTCWIPFHFSDTWNSKLEALN